MKTWTNPTVEELEVMMTADGQWDVDFEKFPYMPDYDIFGDRKQS